MMSITHEEARRLIQFSTDKSLHGFEKELMDVHLETCGECRGYAKSIQELELVLRPMMQNRWNSFPLPLSRNEKRLHLNSHFVHKLILATRIAAMGVICIAFLFNIWQFTRPTGQPSNDSSAVSLPAPTPSFQSTSTTISEQNCAPFLYDVQQGDTLDSIAKQFLVTRAEILRDNNIRVDSLNPPMKLMIHTCSPTPTNTQNTATTVFTPWSTSTTSTPMG